MSLGSPRVTVRLPADLLAMIGEELESQKANGVYGPEDLSAFIVRAIRERIQHRKRSRAKRRVRTTKDKDGWPQERWTLEEQDQEGA